MHSHSIDNVGQLRGVHAQRAVSQCGVVREGVGDEIGGGFEFLVGRGA